MLKDLLAKTNSELEPRLIGEVGKNTLLACYRVGLYLDKKMLSSGLFTLNSEKNCQPLVEPILDLFVLIWHIDIETMQLVNNFIRNFCFVH